MPTGLALAATSSPPVRVRAPRLLRGAIAACVGAAWFVAAGGLLAPPRGWFVFRAPDELPLVAVGLAGITALLATSATAQAGVARAVRRVLALPRWVGLPALALVLFGMRNRNRLLGDTDLLLRQVGDGTMTISASEPLDVLLHAVVHRLSTIVHASDEATLAYVGLSILAGLVFVHLPARLAGTLALGRWGRHLVTVLMLTVTSVQLFFGYAESYSLCAVFLVASMVSALGALRDDASLERAAILLGVAAALHPQALYAVPGLVAARWWQGRPSPGTDLPRLLLLAIGPIAALWVAIILAPAQIHFSGQGNGLLVPLRAAHAPKELFTLFSPDHLTAVANELLLLVPVPLMVLAATVLVRRRGAAANPPLDLQERYLGLTALGGLALVVLVHPDRGPAADWDLYATTAFPTAAFAAAYVGRRLAEPTLRRLVPVAGAASLTTTATFVLANATIAH